METVMGIYKQKDLEIANLPVRDDDTVKHYKTVLRAQERVEKCHEAAVLQFIKDEDGVDLEEERRSWSYYKIQHEGKSHRSGNIIVQQWNAGEHCADTLRREWEIPKSKLLRRYAPVAK